MPCYDKKLEASREDFYNDIYRTRDVDCVISTSKFVTFVLKWTAKCVVEIWSYSAKHNRIFSLWHHLLQLPESSSFFVFFLLSDAN